MSKDVFPSPGEEEGYITVLSLSTSAVYAVSVPLRGRGADNMPYTLLGVLLAFPSPGEDEGHITKKRYMIVFLFSMSFRPLARKRGI